MKDMNIYFPLQGDETKTSFRLQVKMDIKEKWHKRGISYNQIQRPDHEGSLSILQ